MTIMKELLAFMGEHPWLTFFLALIFAEMVYRSCYAFGPKLCQKCRGVVVDEDDED